MTARMEIPHKDNATPTAEERRPKFTFALSAAHVEAETFR
jgi:hypothetical protein